MTTSIILHFEVWLIFSDPSGCGHNNYNGFGQCLHVCDYYVVGVATTILVGVALNILYFPQDESLLSFIKGGLRIRQCYNMYK